MRKAIALAKKSKCESISDQQQYPSKEEEPDGQARAAELRQRLAMHLVELPKRQADAFVLSRIEGLKHDRIAEILGCSEGTARVHLHRALKRLAEELSDYLTE